MRGERQMEKKTIRFRVYRFDSEAEPYTETVDSEKQAEAVERDRRFLGWVTGWMEAEVTK